MADLDYKVQETIKDAKAYWNTAINWFNGAAVAIAGALATFSTFLEPKWAAVVAMVSGVISMAQSKIVDAIKK